MTTVAIQQKKTMTAEEYLILERKSLRERAGKHEFFNQKRIHMAGGSHPHNKTIVNTAYTLINQTRHSNIKLDITTSETKVPSHLHYKNYFYPDVVVVEGQPLFEDEHKDIITNPSLIIEVLSEGTALFDRGDKFKSYRQISTLKEYILIDSQTKCIEQFYKDDSGRWQIGDVIEEAGGLQLFSFPIKLALEEVYFEVEFETQA